MKQLFSICSVIMHFSHIKIAYLFLLTMLWSVSLSASDTNTSLIKTNLLLNQVIIHTLLMYLDLQDQQTKTTINKLWPQLNKIITTLPQSKQFENKKLILTIQGYWSILMQHLQVLTQQSKNSRLPSIITFYHALLSLSEKIVLLHNLQLKQKVDHISPEQHIIKVVTLIQLLTIEYLSSQVPALQINKESKQEIIIKSGLKISNQLKRMQYLFSENLLYQNMLTSITPFWSHFKVTIASYPKETFPFIMALHNDAIVYIVLKKTLN